MKKLIVIAIMALISTDLLAATTKSQIPACFDSQSFKAMLAMSKDQDDKGLGYLFDNHKCFLLKVGLQYSELGVKSKYSGYRKVRFIIAENDHADLYIPITAK